VAAEGAGKVMVDFAVQRLNMVETQVRPNGITDARILSAMAALPRELFVPEGKRDLAYMDGDLSVGSMADGTRRFLMEPMAFARLLQLADIAPGDVVLDVGCGTGYSTAAIARLAKSVLGLEEDQGLAETARRNLAELAVPNAEVIHGALSQGLPARAPFDAILVNGRIPAPPTVLLRQLAEGGRLVAVIGESAVAPATTFVRKGGVISSLPAFDASVAPLAGFPVPRRGFVF
jgi:protein-L-isoaspartate(D-aspartate) O-methyltransferase